MRSWSSSLQALKIDRRGPVRSVLTDFQQDQKGSVLPVMTALLVLAVGGAALAVDVGRAYAVKSDLQAAADSAALAAAIMLPDTKAARQAAQRAVDRSLPDLDIELKHGDLAFGHWNAAARALDAEDGSASAVQVTVELSEGRGNAPRALFAGLFGKGKTEVATSATAGKGGIYCLLSLDQKGKGLEVKGDSELELRACSAQVNSDSKDALKVSGKKSSLIGDGFCISGGAKIDGSATVLPQPSEYCPPYADPLIDLAIPAAGACTDNGVEFKNETISLSPGRVFCGGVKLSGDTRVFLEPGVYFVKDGKLELKNDAKLEGDGVTIVLHGDKSEIDVKEHSSLHLTAPTSGDMKGMLIVKAREFGPSDSGDTGGGGGGGGGKNRYAQKDNKWDSKAPSEMTGVIYLPSDKFTTKLDINITGTDSCFVVISKEIKLDGKAKMVIDLNSAGCRNSLPAAFTRSVVLLA